MADWPQPASNGGNVPRQFGPQDDRGTTAHKVVFNEDQLRTAITASIANIGIKCSIILGADIYLSRPLTLSTNLPAIHIDGNNVYRIVMLGGVRTGIENHTNLLLSDLTMSNTSAADCIVSNYGTLDATGLTINAKSTTSIFLISSTADVLTSVSDTVVNTSLSDGYVFRLDGTHQNTKISHIKVVDDGTLTAFIGAGATSTHWTATNVGLYGCGNFLKGVFRLTTIEGWYCDLTSFPSGGTLSAAVDRSKINNLRNISTINTTGGTENTISNIVSDISSTITTTSNDIVFGVSGTYTSTLGNKATYIANSPPSSLATVPSVFSQGLAVGTPAANTGGYEEIIPGIASTSNATITAIFSYTTESNAGYYFEFDVVARQTNGTNQTNVYKLGWRVKNNGGILTTGTITTLYMDEEVPAWDITLDTSGTAVRVRATGALATNITWGTICRVRRI